MSRYGNVKAGAFNKINVENETEDTGENLNDVERVLTKIGVSIRDTNLQFKDFDTVLDEIASRWENLDNVSKKAIANAFAGVRQQEAFLILLNNYDKYQDLLEVSQNSAGTAEKKYQSYQESYEAAKNSMTAALEEFTNSAQLNNLLTDLVNIGTEMVKWLKTIIPYIPALISTIGAVKAMGHTTALNKIYDRFSESGFGTNFKQNLLNIGSGYQSFSKTKIGKGVTFLPNLLGKGVKKTTELVKDKAQERADKKHEKNLERFNKLENDQIQKKMQAAREELNKKQQVSQAGEKEKINKKITLSDDDKRLLISKGILADARHKLTLAQAEELVESGVLKDTKLGAYLEEQVLRARQQGAAAETQISTGKGGGGKVGGALAGISMVATTAISAFSQLATAGTTHKNSLGEDVSSSKNAQRAAGGTAAVVSLIPIIGSWIAPKIAEWVSAAIDKERDEMNSITDRSNERLSGLEGISSSLQAIKEAQFGSLESQKAVEQFAKEMYSTEEGNKTRELLERYLGRDIRSVLDDINKNGEESAKALRDIQTAQLEAQKAEITGKYASQMYRYGNDTEEAYAAMNNQSGYGADVFGAQAGVVVGGAAAGTALGATAATLAGVGAANGWNPVGWALLILGAITGIVAGSVAASNIGDSMQEQNRLEYSRGSDWNSMSLSEKLESAKTEMINAESENNTQRVAQLNKLITCLERQIGISNQMNNELNSLTLEAAAISAHITRGGETSYITDMTVAQLRNLGVGEIIQAYAEALKDEGDLIGRSVWANTEKTELTESGYSYLLKQLKGLDIDAVNAVLSGETYTLNEALKLQGQYQGTGSANERWVNGILENFATSLGVSVKDLGNYSNIYGALTLAETYLQTSEFTEKIQGYTDLISNIADGAGDVSGWMNTIVSQFPELIKYMSDIPTLFSQIGNKLQQLANSELRTQFQDIASNSEFYNSIKEEFYSGLTSEQKAALDAYGAAGVTSVSDLLKYVQTTGDESVLDKLKEVIKDEKITSAYLKSYFDSITSYRSKMLESEIENLTTQRDMLKEINSQREYENKLIEARLKLENAEKNKKKVYRAGVGMVYEADQAEIKAAQEALKNLETEKQTAELNKQIEILQDQKDRLEGIADQINAETMQKGLEGYYKDHLEAVGPDGFYKSIVNGVQGISEYLSQLLNEEVERNKEEKANYYSVDESGKITGELADAWQAVLDSENLSQYNAAISNYYDVAKNAKKNGVTDEQIAALGKYEHEYYVDSENKTDEYKRKFHVDALSATQESDVSKLQKVIPYSIRVKDTKGNTWIGWTNGDSLAGSAYTGDILGDLKSDNEAYVWDANGNLLYPGDNTFKPTDDDKNFDEYAKRVAAASGYKTLIFAGNAGGDEAALYMGGQIYKVLHSKNSKGLWYDKKDESGYALGISEAAAEGSLGLNGNLSLINELGTEAIITPNGTITALPSGTGVVPADITKNLWTLGEIAPALLRFMTSRLVPDVIGKSALVTTQDDSFNIGNLEMNVTADSSFDVNKFVASVKAKADLTRNTRK